MLICNNQWIDWDIAENVLHFFDYQTMAGGPNVPSGNMAMKHGPFIDEFPKKTSIQRGFSIAMF